MENKKYNFGEKKEESINGKNLPVWQTPKYLKSKEKAIEMIESNKYDLSEADFWILMNTYANGAKVMYTGLIISHNGCLKINDNIDNKVKPDCFIVDKEGFNNSLTFTYIDEDTYEVGECNASNCKNSYIYAMAYKRCFDRVVLKKSKLAYSGIYSEVEADEFKEKPQEDNTDYRQELIKYCEAHALSMNELAVKYKLNAKTSNIKFKEVLEILKSQETGEVK